MSNVKSIIKKRLSTESLWNLAVEQDESFIANSVVVHNCRSLLIPITKYEEYKADTKVGSKDIDKFIEDNKGEGFSRYSEEHKPRVTDSDTTYVIYRPNPKQEVYVYSKKGVEFKRTTVNYKDNAHAEILSVNHEDVKQ